MGNFCTQCGRPLQEGEVCNCTQQNQAPQPAPAPAPQPAPEAAVQPAPAPAPQTYQQVPPQPVNPSQTSIEIKNGFNNLITALKTIWTNPAKAASALAEKDCWLPAILLIAAQALFSGLFALTSFGVGLDIDKAEFLLVAFFFTFVSSLALSAAGMGMYLAMGKAVKGDVSFKAALSTASIRCFVCLPLTFLGLLLSMANVGIGLLFFFIGEILAILLTVMAVQENYKLSANRTFIVVGATYLTIFILFVIAASIYCSVNLMGIFGRSYYYW